MEKKCLVRRASAPVVGPRPRRQAFSRAYSLLQLNWKSPGNLCPFYPPTTGVPVSSHRINSSNNEIKLPCIEGGMKRNVQEGKRKMDKYSEAKLTKRTVNLPENRRLTAKLHSTYRRRNSAPSQFVWRNDRPEEQSKALREFVKNAEENFDSTKEKAVVIFNWLSTQSLTTQWIKQKKAVVISNWLSTQSLNTQWIKPTAMFLIVQVPFIAWHLLSVNDHLYYHL